MLDRELDHYIRQEADEGEALRDQIETLRREVGVRLASLGDSFRLYETLTGHSHASQRQLTRGKSPGQRSSPRLDHVLAVLDRSPGPVTVDQVVASMPDAPERGAVTAALHRAVKSGEARRLRRGVYVRANASTEVAAAM